MKPKSKRIDPDLKRARESHIYKEISRLCEAYNEYGLIIASLAVSDAKRREEKTPSDD